MNWLRNFHLVDLPSSLPCFSPEKVSIDNIRTVISNNIPCAIVKNFYPSNLSLAAANEIEQWAFTLPPHNTRLEPDRTSSNFWSLDILPRSVLTNRVMRDFMLGDLSSSSFQFSDTYKLFDKLNSFHFSHVLNNDVNAIQAFKYAPQILHIPEGGGFFDWHVHSRYPQNYGFLLMIKSNTIVESSNAPASMIVKFDDIIYSTQGVLSPGDLFIFRYDLLHAITPHLPLNDLNLSHSGAYFAVNPLIKPCS
ncbi:hypothetical protein SynBIOSU31_00266 [Synechococcus sp. BIOS-U3-1]|uniref:hypothetical protein n=1 Tax=Synechococcus sp. BIOS-U3-1 TaxID=1400865 RepID=UPI001647428A|nr:hypothetical protein [Synechococcus sp. BIOS-U3-1]QNI57180.1 hypothetical protein SynBIOSU31_00266 [Synechococcus sp. BIOS-U3-1]